ncbi:MAG: MBL fold metallo-hydrolase [Candidatus Lokiarchaeota archaeon]
MTLPKIDNLELRKVTNDVLLIHQKKTPFYFSCCDGLIILPKRKRNKTAIALDLNIEPILIDKIDEIFGPFNFYVCSHGHMDHMAHVHHWGTLGATIYAPKPESTYLLDLYNFYEGFGFNEQVSFTSIEKFAESNKYMPCKQVNDFSPGLSFKFENVVIETIPLVGHSKSHCGFFIPNEKILHISCLGFDKPNPRSDGFGPWYGFKECSISQYIKDIDLVEKLFLKRANYLTSSHSYVIKQPDTTPFSYMRNKIKQNQEKVDQAIKSLKITNQDEININELLELDLFFPKKKLKGFILDLYRYWESIIIVKHLERSELIKVNKR